MKILCVGKPVDAAKARHFLPGCRHTWMSSSRVAAAIHAGRPTAEIRADCSAFWSRLSRLTARRCTPSAGKTPVKVTAGLYLARRWTNDKFFHRQEMPYLPFIGVLIRPRMPSRALCVHLTTSRRFGSPRPVVGNGSISAQTKTSYARKGNQRA